MRRVLGPVDAAWLVAGNMIGAGIFYTPGLVAGQLPGGLWPLAAWLLGGVLALCSAAVYAELGARLPHAGGDYRYLAAAFGPAWGFLTGWSAMLLTFSAAAAAMCIVATSYLQAAWPPLTLVPSSILAPALVVLLTAANVAGARVAGRTTAWLTALPLLGLLALFGWGLVSRKDALHWPTNDALPDSWLLALGAAMPPIFFTYSGWNAAAYVAGEVKDPGRNLARGLLGGTLFVTAVYLAINTLFLAVIPEAALAGSTTAGADAARALLGPSAERLLALLIAIAVLGSANVTLMAGSRVYYAMARDGLAPRSLARISATGVPAAALWAGGAWSALLSLSDKVDTLVNWAALAILLLSSLVTLALFVLRRRGGEEPAYRCTGYPLTPLVYLVAALAIAAASAISAPRESLYGVLIVLSGLPVYAWLRHRGAASAV
jgi:APA family basic amino acid/polyamine antiporter